MKFAARIARLLVGAAFACAAQPATAAEAPSLRVVYNALGGSMVPVWVAQELGLFAKHGLQHSLNYLAATTAVQALKTDNRRALDGIYEDYAGAFQGYR